MNQPDLVSLLPPEFNHKAAGCCMVAAQIVGRNLIRSGFDNFEVIEGYVKTGQSSGRGYMHTWFLINGEIFDPTLEQFDVEVGANVRRTTTAVYSPEEYLSELVLNTAHPEIYFDNMRLPQAVRELFEKSFEKLKASQVLEFLGA